MEASQHPDKTNTADILALTPLQEGLLFHYLDSPEGDSYFEQLSLELTGEIELELFFRAWNVVIETNEMLRTVFRWQRLDRPIQIVLKSRSFTPRYYDLSKAGGDGKQQIEHIKVQDRGEKFDLRQVPFRVTLCRLAESHFVMIVSFHHILYDGWSSGIVLKEFLAAYDDLAAGKSPERPVKNSFKEFIHWSQSRDKDKQEKFWQEYLTGLDDITDLPAKQPAAGANRNIKSQRVEISGRRKELWQRFTKENKLTLAALLYAAWGLLLQKYCNSRDVVFGTTVSGRSAGIKGIEEMVGLFINTIPFRVNGDGDGDERVTDWLCRLNDDLRMRKPFETTSLVNIKECCRLGHKEELFDTLVVIENYPLDYRLKQRRDGMPFAIVSYSMFETSNYDLTVGILMGDDGIAVNFKYNDERYKETVAAGMSAHYVNILNSLVDNPDHRLSAIDGLSPAERRQLIVDFNDTRRPFPQDRTIWELFEDRACACSDHTAVVLGNSHLSYEGVNRGADNVAHLLWEWGVRGGSIVAILMERSLDLIAVMLGILKAGGAYLPLGFGYPDERLKYMLADSGAAALVTAKGTDFPHSGIIRLAVGLNLDGDSGCVSAAAVKGRPDDPAYVIYTSGSTGRPKGVLVEQKSVVNMVSFFALSYEIGRGVRLLQMSDYTFDASVNQIFGTLLAGGVLYLISSRMLADVVAVRAYIVSRNIEIINFVPAYLDELLGRGGRLKCLRAVISGAERLDAALRDRLLARGYGVYNQYGPTEATVDALAGECEAGGIVKLGKPIANMQVFILAIHGSVQPLRAAGEICISGVGLSRGYLNRVELTAEKFIKNQILIPKSQILYRTGDLGRFLEGGTVEFLGRADHQVKIRGFRVELAEIETLLLKYEPIKEAAAALRAGLGGDKTLAAYLVLRSKDSGHPSPSLDESFEKNLKNYLAAQLPHYMIPSRFVQLSKIPLTPHGKIDRQSLPEPEFRPPEQFVKPGGEVEEKVAEIWSEILGIEKGIIGLYSNFFELGGHSLRAMMLTARLHKAFNIRMPLSELFNSPDIEGMAAYIKSAAEDRFWSIEATETREYYGLSSAQRRLFILHQLEQEPVGYNMSGAVLLKGEIETARLEEAFVHLIGRHESLRSSFELIDSVAVQRIHGQVDFEITHMDGKEETGPGQFDRFIENFIAPFDLARPPLLRAGLIKVGPDEHILMVDMHHIVSDAVSLDILIEEFTALYRQQPLPDLRIQYKDYARWQNRERRKASFRKQADYWLTRFCGQIPRLQLPTDYPRPAVQSFEGRALTFEIAAAETEALKALALKGEATLYMVLLSIFYLLLARLSGQEDIVVGTPTAGRRHADLRPIIGMFVNTLALRHFPVGQKSFGRFLEEVKESTLSAFENQDYPFEDLVDELKTVRDVGRNPLFDVMFVLQNAAVSELTIPGLTLTPYRYENRAAKFDLSLDGVEREDNLTFTIEYSVKLFRQGTIQRFADYFHSIVNSVLAYPDTRLCRIDIITPAEKDRILYQFNHRESAYPQAETLHERFEIQVGQTPHRLAIVTPPSGKSSFSEQQITYAELNGRANRLARQLRQQGVGPGSIVGLMVERSLYMMTGILAILKAGGAYLPIDPLYPPERIDYMLADSGARVIITDHGDGLLSSVDGQPSTLRRTPYTLLAYVIYTSGSTGRPRGVLVEHRNVLAYLSAFYREFDISLQDTALQQASVTFDAFVEEIYPTLLKGGKVAICPKAVVIDTEALFRFILRQRITFISVSPLLLNELNKLPHTGGIRIFISGGDVLKRGHLGRLVDKGNVYNTYGPTETTVCATYYRCSPADKGEPPIGSPITHYSTHILDRYGRLQPVGLAGELCIGGPGVSRGYLNNPELTAEKFQYLAAKAREDTQSSKDEILTPRSQPLYRTGDLVRWRADGNIEFLGRLDHQVKIRGYRIEPGEIENRLLQRDDIAEAVVAAGEDSGEDRYLAAYVVCSPDRSVNNDLLVSELRAYLARQLPEYMVPAYFVEIEKIPLTAHGKVDRKALPQPQIQPESEYAAPANELEARLVEIWSEVLGIDAEKIGMNADFFRLGGHSLKGTILTARIHQVLQVRVPLVELFKTPTIRGLARYIGGSAVTKYTAIPAAEEKEYYPLSSPQKRLYILQQLEPQHIVYNMPGVVELQGTLDRECLDRSFRQLAARHEGLRTSFQLRGDIPVQRIQKNVDFKLEYRELAGSSRHTGEVIAKFGRPFDLSSPPLLRVGLVRIREDRHVLMIDLHHIVADGISLGILMKELIALYGGGELPDLKLQYKDYSEWQNRQQREEPIGRQEAYWLNRFTDRIPLLHLPTDYARPVVQSFQGGTLTFELAAAETGALKALALKEGATLYMLLLSLFSLWLSRLSGQEDMVVGTPTAGRRNAELRPIVGMFVNTLALRHFPAAEKPFIEFLREVKESTLTAFENQEYPFEDLVEKLKISRDVGRNPLFDVLFALQNMEIPELEMGGLKLEPYEYEAGISKFDVTLQALEADPKIIFTFGYSTKLFKPATVNRWPGYFKNVVDSVLRQPAARIAQSEIITPAERQQILVEFNRTAFKYPADKTIHEMLEEQVEQTPDHIAVVGPALQSGHITYREFNRKANCLAVVLRRKGVRTNTIIGILSDRSIELVTGIFSILKSGGAYLPIDPGYPQDRIQFMMADSGARILLTQPGYGDDSISAEILDVTDENTDGWESGNPERINGAEDFIYLIYTSGSTGRPKGVLIRHRGVANLIGFHRKIFAEAPGVRMSQVANPGFDAMAFEIWPCLLSGAALYIADQRSRLDPVRMKQWLIEKEIMISFQPTVMAEHLLNEAWPERGVALRALRAAGDKLTRYPARHYPFIVYNLYGPTEDTVWTTWREVASEPDSGSAPDIGRPIGNRRVYIIGDNGQLQPSGVLGELCIGGVGAAAGYLNSPELTAAKFVADPFVPAERIYKTGDLCKWLPDGNIEFVGRIDSQVKIRGFRIELAEIENQLLAHEAINEAVVIAREDQRGERRYLCAYVVADEDITASRLKECLSLKLPDYMIPAYFVQLAKMPVTPNGKIDRQALPEPEITVAAEYVAPTTDIEKRLVDLWQELLGLEGIGVTDHFFHLGGHSLTATILVNRVRREFDVEFPLTRVFVKPTIRDFADFIRGSRRAMYEDIKPAEKREYYPLSSAQKRLFFLDQFEHIGTSYNIPFALEVGGRLDRGCLQSVMKALIDRHETLRTSFQFIANEPVQRIFDRLDFRVEETRINEVKTTVIEKFVRPFDLKKAPLLRVEIGLFSAEEQLLLFDIHHIVSDGTSMGTLIREFTELYAGEELPPLKIQYKDFSAWQNNLIKTGRIKDQEEYWLNLYSGEIPRLNLPTDFPRPAVMSFTGDNYGFRLGRQDSSRFKALASGNGATLYMNMLAALNVLLYRYTGQTDIIVGSGIAGRAQADLQPVIGMFVNTLAMRSEPAGDKTYLQFLAEVRDTSILAYENQDMQFEELVERLNLERDPSRNPLFDVCFVVQNFEQPRIESQGIVLIPYEYENITSKFDITLYAWEVGDEVYGSLEYYTRIFTRQTIEGFANHLRNIIEQVCSNPEIRLTDIEMLSEAERRSVIREFNRTATGYPKERTIHGLFEDQAAQAPDHIALIFEEESLTYRQLDERSNRVANYLYAEKNIRPEDQVGMMMARSLDLMVVIMGILKAGAAYVPIDPAFPEERIRGMVNDARIGVLISQRQFIKTLNRLQWECPSLHTFLCMDSRDVYAEEEVEKSELMGTKLWEYVGQTATDEITGGGWLSSYTGQPIPGEEMDEYGDNILKKLAPLLHKGMRILEIGCASGISMYRLAPKVGFYYGTDLSAVIIDRNRQRIKDEGHRNIALACLPAHEIEKIEERDFDLVIINSVIQCFHGHNYLRKVIHRAVGLLKQRGCLFIGDVMDQDLKQALIDDLAAFKRSHRDKHFKTKTDWSTELFVSRGFIEDLVHEIPGIQQVEFSDKIYTLENELTRFRYDALLWVDKTQKAGVRKEKHKYQHGARVFLGYGSERLTVPVGPHHLAYVMYTSGSTGEQKGVMVVHRNVVRLVKHTDYVQFNGRDRILQTGALEFDASTFEIWGALLNGLGLYLLSKETLLTPGNLKQAIRQYEISIMWMTSPLFNQMLDEDIEIFAGLRSLLVGGDVISPLHINRLIQRYPHINVINGYGPTENTTFSTTFLVGREYSDHIPIGRPIANSTAYIVDRCGKLQPIGVAGELWVGGDGVSRGYLNNPELTAEKFVNHQILSPKSYILNPKFQIQYRTGDLCRFLPDGNIEFIGRLDFQVKIRGYRIELGEIENQLLRHEDVREAVVIVREDSAGEQRELAAYLVVSGDVDISALREYLAVRLPDFMIPAYFVQLDVFPLTPNGKIDRRALPEPESSLAVEGYIAPRDALERKLAEIWSGILGLDKGMIGVGTNFFELGGHSLKATILVSRLYKELNVKVPLAEIFRTPTIEELAKYIKEARQDQYASIEAVEEREYYPLSSAQKRLYVLQQMEPAKTHYNIPDVFLVEGPLRVKRLEDAFKRLIQRHQGLRTSFEILEDRPQQRIHETVDFEIEFWGGGNPDKDEIIDGFIRPFVLSQPPLLRLGLIRLAENEHILMIDMHHIISDGVSMGILVNEFKKLFKGEPLPPLSLQYKDFTLWQNKLFEAGEIEKQETYWLTRFKETLPSLNLPTDYPRPPFQGFLGEMIHFQADTQLAEQLSDLARETGTTLFMVLLAAYNVLLFHYTGQEDIVVGSPIAGRVHPDLESVIGMFANTLALRNYPRHQTSFRHFLEDVKQNTLKDYENQDYQFDMLVDRLQLKRQSGRNPLFDTVFALQNVYAPDIEAAELKVTPYKYRHQTTHFDIFLEGIEDTKGIRFIIEYSTELFQPATIEKMAVHFINILRTLTHEPDIDISAVDMRSEAEKKQIFAFSDFNEGENYEFE